jgi:hypothetical protein
MLREQQEHRAQNTEQFQAEMDKLRQAEVGTHPLAAPGAHCPRCVPIPMPT